MRSLRAAFFVVDFGFVAYWLVTLTHVLPERWLFKDYHEPILHAWNWSFLPLDMAISLTGFTSLLLARRGDARWERFALVSLALTSASGMQALAFWALRHDVDALWWTPNLFLLLYPIPYAVGLLRSPASAAAPARPDIDAR
jgi:hypothetical protein